MYEEEVSISASVICPVTNMAGRLQKFEKWVNEISLTSHIETIIVHDFADEATRSELTLICSGLQNVQLIEGKFGNPGSARNAGLMVAIGKQIAFWDSDDEPNTAQFVRLLKSEQVKNTDISIARYNIFDEITKSMSPGPIWSGNFGHDSKVFALNPGIWRMIFKRDILSDITFNPLKMAEDQIFICQAMMKAKTITFIDDQIYTYFTGSSNHLTKNNAALQDLMPAMQKTKALIRQNSQADLAPLLNLMFARQFISGLKHGSLHTKLSLLMNSIDHGFILRISFFKALTYILKI